MSDVPAEELPEGVLVARALRASPLDGPASGPKPRALARASAGELPEGVLVARVGAGANCSSAGSAIDILFYTSVIAGAIAVALSAAFPPRPIAREGGPSDGPPEGRGDADGRPLQAPEAPSSGA